MASAASASLERMAHAIRKHRSRRGRTSASNAAASPAWARWMSETSTVLPLSATAIVLKGSVGPPTWLRASVALPIQTLRVIGWLGFGQRSLSG